MRFNDYIQITEVQCWSFLRDNNSFEFVNIAFQLVSFHPEVNHIRCLKYLVFIKSRQFLEKMSSAKRFTSEFTNLGKSFTYRKKNEVPSTESCGTPHRTSFIEDSLIPI